MPALLPSAGIVLCDVLLRHAELAAYTRAAAASYVGCGALGVLAWSALVAAAAPRRSAVAWTARGLLAALAVFALGTQLQTWDRYGSYLGWRTTLLGCSITPFVGHVLRGARVRALGILLAPLAGAGVAVGLALRWPPLPPRVARWGLPLGVAALVAVTRWGRPDAGWDHGTTPDVLWVDAAGALATSLWTHDDIMVRLPHPEGRTPDALPALHARRAPAPRSVLLLVDESVRAPEVCSVPAATCAATPVVNALLPDRFGFRQMRALDSTTTLSLTALLAGVPPGQPRAELLSAPMLPEFAHAAGLDAAFWTAQNLLFANTGRFLEGLPLAAFASGTEFAPYATYETGADDGALLARVLADTPRLREPYLAVAQLSNTHFPYVVDPADVPFSRATDWHKLDSFGQTALRYRDAIHRQDKLLGSFLAAFRAGPGRGAVIVFISDHGEQLGERGRIGHTWTVYDDEVRVPMWIDAPPGALSESESAHLRALADTPLAMVDVAPTLLDLLGLWDDAAIAPWRGRMPGTSLLRGGPPPDRALVFTNCSPLYGCSMKNWGAMRGWRKLVGKEEESTDVAGGWRCFDVRDDPREAHDLGPEACGDLRDLAEADGRGRPF